MGSESRCRAQYEGKRSEGVALLESDHVLFRGDFRLRIPHRDITALAAEGDTLRVTFAGGIAAFELGAGTAAKWAEKIRNPRSLLDKLGVKTGMRVAVLGVDDETFRTQLAARTEHVTTRTPTRATEMIFLGAESTARLERLTLLRNRLTPSGAIWVVHRKGKGAPLRDVDVFAAAKRAGLVDVKVASFSATHTAEKLVIPVKQRA